MIPEARWGFGNFLCLLFADGGGVRQQSAAWGGGELPTLPCNVDIYIIFLTFDN